ncbi:MAG: vitamin K-dependent gamma-carboxylase [Bacteroidia bacterium]|jgi:vitamin K-dependent gamma-carboxylase
MLNKLIEWCNAPVNSKQLGVFRILFGVITIIEVIYYYRIGYVQNLFVLPKLLFSYEFFPFGILPEGLMHLMIGGLALSSVLITLGLYFRWAVAYFFLVFTYFFLLDQSNYNNHFYLFSLISFLLCFTNADASYSLAKSRWAPQIPRWQIRIFQFQIGVVLFFGGIAKINPFWFDFHPITEILSVKAESSGLEFLNHSITHYVLMIGGLVFDLLAVFLLLMKRTRMLAIGLVSFFNLANSWLFDDIGSFPLFMMFSLFLFLDDDELDKLPLPRQKIIKPVFKTNSLKHIGVGFALVYVLLQVTLPLRHFLYHGYPDWTGEGQRFAWRMKIQYREFDRVTFSLTAKESELEEILLPEQHITIHQYRQMTNSPQSLVLFAEYAEGLAKKRNPNMHFMVKCNAKVKFNGSEYVNIFASNLDILEASRTHKSYNDWIEPMPTAYKN